MFLNCEIRETKVVSTNKNSLTLDVSFSGVHVMIAIEHYQSCWRGGRPKGVSKHYYLSKDRVDLALPCVWNASVQATFPKLDMIRLRIRLEQVDCYIASETGFVIIMSMRCFPVPTFVDQSNWIDSGGVALRFNRGCNHQEKPLGWDNCGRNKICWYLGLMIYLKTKNLSHNFLLTLLILFWIYDHENACNFPNLCSSKFMGDRFGLYLISERLSYIIYSVCLIGGSATCHQRLEARSCSVKVLWFLIKRASPLMLIVYWNFWKALP